MLLVIDIGNTTIALGVFEKEELRASWHMATAIHRMGDEYANLMLNLLHGKGLHSSQIMGIALCSVVPPLTATFEHLSQQYFHISPFVVAAGVKTGVRILMDNPSEVGSDRIINAAAAHYLYRGPTIITDLSTATTLDTVSKEGDYMGGAIAPGIAIAAESLFTRTALLPRVELAYPKYAIGTNTVAAMQSGIMFGYVGLVEGIIARIQAELDEKAKVVATGKYSGLIAKGTSVIDLVNPDLTLIGLRLIYQMNRTLMEKANPRADTAR